MLVRAEGEPVERRHYDGDRFPPRNGPLPSTESSQDRPQRLVQGYVGDLEPHAGDGKEAIAPRQEAGHAGGRVLTAN